MSQPTAPADLSFEDAFQRLQDIVAAMESDSMPLEAMVSAFEEGGTLLNQCRAHIESARQRVELISARMDEPGATVLTPLDPAAAGSEAEQPPAGGRSTPARAPARRSSSPAARHTSTDNDEDIRLL